MSPGKTLFRMRARLDHPDQRGADFVRKGSRAGGGEAEDLQSMRQRARKPERAAIFSVVMDRVIVEAHRLKGREIRVADRPGRERIAIADAKVGESSGRNEPVLRVNFGQHRLRLVGHKV